MATSWSENQIVNFLEGTIHKLCLKKYFPIASHKEYGVVYNAVKVNLCVKHWSDAVVSPLKGN